VQPHELEMAYLADERCRRLLGAADDERRLWGVAQRRRYLRRAAARILRAVAARLDEPGVATAPPRHYRAGWAR
jgi:hypothetical protein